MFVISNEELSNKQPLEETYKCYDCGEQHIVKYGDKILKDGTKVESKLLAFITCPITNKSYMVGINGMKIRWNVIY